MVVPLTFGHQHLSARQMQPELGRLLGAVGVEDDGHLHRTGSQATQALHDGDGALPQRVGDLAMAGGDGRLHDCPSRLSRSPSPSMMSLKMSLGCRGGALPGESFRKPPGPLTQRATSGGESASSTMRAASASTSP